MKKLAAAIVLALVLSLAAPAFAAVEFGGKLENQFELHEVAGEWRVDGETGIDVETKVTGENGNTIKGVVELGFESGYNEKDEVDGTRLFDNLLDGITLQNLAVQKAWVESQGAYWHGGPDVTTKIGDVGPEWDPVVAHMEDMRGVTVDGLATGPAMAKAFYLWDGADRPVGVAANGSVDGVDLSGMIVRKGTENNMVFGAGSALIPGVNVAGKVALDGANRRLYNIEATAQNLVEGVTLRAGYRGADDAFAPMYTIAPEDEEGNAVARNHVDNVHYDLLDGYSIGVETVQSGVHLKADYDQPHELVNLSAATDIHGFNLGYAAKLQRGADAEHKVKAKTVVNAIQQLQGLGLSAEVKLVGNTMTWNTGAEYNAPNGLDLGAKYDSVDGPSATAGVTVKF